MDGRCAGILADGNVSRRYVCILCKIPVRHGKRAERARRKGAARGAVVRRRGCSVCLGRCGVHHSVESVSVLRGQEHSGRSVCEHEIVGGVHHESGWGQPWLAICFPLRRLAGTGQSGTGRGAGHGCNGRGVYCKPVLCDQRRNRGKSGRCAGIPRGAGEVSEAVRGAVCCGTGRILQRNRPLLHQNTDGAAADAEIPSVKERRADKTAASEAV